MDKEQLKILEDLAEMDAQNNNISSQDIISENGSNEEDSGIFWSITDEQCKTLTNFTTSDINNLYYILNDLFSTLRSKKGRKPPIEEIDQLLLFLYYFKTYSPLKQISLFFKASPTYIADVLKKMISLFRPVLESEFIVKYRSLSIDEPFSDFPVVKLVIDCTVQEIPRYSNSFKDNKIFFSNKHKKYCLKRESAHIINGMCVFISKPYPGSRHDFNVFKDMLPYYKEFLKKNDAEDDFFSVMVDKGYEGIKKYLPAEIPYKGKNITSIENKYNKKLARERIIVENFYGRCKTLWKIAREKYRGELEDYENINTIAIALTNFHLNNNPLRKKDGDFFRKSEKDRNSSLDSGNISNLTQNSI